MPGNGNGITKEEVVPEGHQEGRQDLVGAALLVGHQKIQVHLLAAILVGHQKIQDHRKVQVGQHKIKVGRVEVEQVRLVVEELEQGVQEEHHVGRQEALVVEVDRQSSLGSTSNSTTHRDCQNFVGKS